MVGKGDDDNNDDWREAGAGGSGVCGSTISQAANGEWRESAGGTQTQCSSKHALTRANRAGIPLEKEEGTSTATRQPANRLQMQRGRARQMEKKGETRSSATSVPVAKGSRAAGRNKPGRRPRWPRQWNCSTAGLCPGADTGITSKTWNSTRSERSEVQRSRASLQHLASTAPRERRGKKSRERTSRYFCILNSSILNHNHAWLSQTQKKKRYRFCAE